MTNLRSLQPKIDELQVVAKVNNASVISIVETWLTRKIPDNVVGIHDYILMRRDRHFSNKSAGGGVCAYIHHKIPAKRLHTFEPDSLETLLINVKPFRHPRHTSTILFEIIYHPPSAKAEDNDALIEHINSNVNLFLSKYPDSLVVITREFNPCSTNISLSPLTTGSDLTQFWCLVNKPKQFKAIERLPNIGNSDHHAMVMNPKG